MMNSRFLRRAAVWTMALLLMTAMSVPAYATHVGVGGDPPGNFNGTKEDGVNIGSPANPIPVFPSPDAGPWTKQINVAFNDLSPGDTIRIWEWIAVFPPPSGRNIRIWDWHEDFIDSTIGPQFEWAGGILNILDPNTGNVIGGGPGMVMANQPNGIWFKFPPGFLPPFGIEIHKELRYIGTQTFTAGNINLLITEHFTTPAPAALPAGLALLATLGLRRRHRKVA